MRTRSEKILTAYLRMARGLWRYTVDDCEDDCRRIARGEDPALIDSPVTDDIERMLSARGSSRQLFVLSGAVAKPSWLQNRLYCAALREQFGDVSDVPGFDSRGVYQLPKGYGLLMPVRMNGRVAELKFYSYGELMKAKRAA